MTLCILLYDWLLVFIIRLDDMVVFFDGCLCSVAWVGGCCIGYGW